MSPDGVTVPEVDTTTLQNAQYYETKANEVVMILKLNADIVTCMKEFYASLLENPGFRATIQVIQVQDAVRMFFNKLQIMHDDFGRAQSRAEILVKESSELKTLVRSSASVSRHFL